MKNITILICAIALLSQLGLAQKTEISVKEGKVLAQTASATVEIDAGRKAVLTADDTPSVMADDILVQEMIKMYGWAQDEKAARIHDIESIQILVGRIDNENFLRGCFLTEWTNNGLKALRTVTFGPTTTMKDPQFYDLNGNLLAFETEPCGDTVQVLDQTRYKIQLLEAVEPGQKVRYIVRGEIHDAMVWLSKGPVWSTGFAANTTKPFLNLTKIILPESAMILGTYPKVILTDMVEGRVALTFRDYVQDESGTLFPISFLWPDKDGTGLKDVPSAIRVLKKPRDLEMAQYYQETMARILSGEKFHDLSTPLNSLLTNFCYIINEDIKGLRSVSISAQNFDSEKLINAVGLYKYFIINFIEFCQTEPFPEDPKAGTVHSIQLNFKGGSYPALIIDFIYKDGQWLSQGIRNIDFI